MFLPWIGETHLLPSGLYRRCRSFNGSAICNMLYGTYRRWVADYTAGWDFHPTLKIQGANVWKIFCYSKSMQVEVLQCC